ncbi:MAG TPA: putative Ig domain-containing protein [Verrucomicrobiales bacterium]|nr:putative Ig domain-containing protein [Verrucomicrobiales bacterium]
MRFSTISAFFVFLVHLIVFVRSGRCDDLMNVTGVVRLGNTMQIDFISKPGATALAVKGSTDLVAWTDDLTGGSSIQEVSPGVYRAIIDITGRPMEKYFLRIAGVLPPDNTAPTLVPPGNREIAPGRAFSTTLFAIDPDAEDELTFTLVAGPDGMTLDPKSGKLDWTPVVEDTGAKTVQVKVEDKAGASDSGQFTVTLTLWPAEPEVRHAPVLTLPPNAVLPAGTAWEVSATATDADAGDTLTYTLLAGPAGLTLDAATGAIAWTPGTTDAGPHEVTVLVRDQTDLSDTGTFSVTVTLENLAPVAVNDIYITPKGETTTVPAPGVMTNDSDPEGDAITATLVDNVKRGTLNFRPDGSFDYKPGSPGIQARLAYGFQKFNNANFKVNDGNAPIAADLNGDGKPEIIAVGQVNNGIANTGWLLALTFDEATRTLIPLWSFKGGVGSPISIYNAPDPAVGDVNGDGKPEVVVNGQCKGEILIFSNTGELLINTQEDKTVGPGTSGGADCYVGGSHPAPVLADLDGDGAAEIIVQYRGTNLRVYNGQGQVVWERPATGVGVNNISAGPLVADVDLDGKLNIYYAGILFDAEGNTLWTLPIARSNYGDRIVAVANLDDDPYGEIVISTGRNPNYVIVIEHDGTCKWNAVNSANPVTGCGPTKPFPNANGPNQRALLIADINGDGLPEIIAASAENSYGHVTVFSRDGNILWQKQPMVGTTNMGSYDVAAFDFDGDGIMEVVVTGRYGTAFLSGLDGAKLFEIPWDDNNPGAAVSGDSLDAIVVDIENDGHAELVITSRDSSLGSSPNCGIYVYKDVNDRWMPTRPVWNQSEYSITNVNADGTIPKKPAVNWLTPGLNNFGVNVPAPDEPGGFDSFTYRVSDGKQNSNTATVTLEIRRKNIPPVILSRPAMATVPGYTWRYQIYATDPDPGDAVTVSLQKGPAGMTLGAGNVLHWTPTAANLGTHTVLIAAQDREDELTVQSFTLNVIEAQLVPDVTGKPRAEAITALEAAGFAGGRITQQDHATVPAGAVISQSPPGGASEAPGAAVALVVSTGPGPANTDGDGDGFTPNQGDCNDANPNIHPGAQDTAGDGIDQDCNGVDGDLTLASLIVEPANARVLTNRLVPLTATAVFTDGTSQNLTGVVTWSTGAPRFSSSTAGTFTVTATKGAISGNAEITVMDRVTDTAAPQAEITSPVSGATITAPTDVLGSAADPNFLKYELSYAPAGTTDFTVITTGSNPVSNGVLGKFDPTTLINDQYTIRLTVYDRGGNESVAERIVQADENLKVGNFSVTYTDLQIPLSGLPITITRTYDSRDKGRGDFGAAWRMGIQSLKLRTSRVPGTGWNVIKSGLAFSLQSSESLTASLTLPDGRVELFDFLVTPQVSPLVPFPPSVLRARLSPRIGTLGKLESLDNNILSIFDTQPGPVELLDDVTLATYNPQRFRYTAPDGTVIIIHTQNGVQSISTPDGNSLTFTPGGILHSSGKSVLFTRDTAGRIVSVTDPAGGIQRYSYDGNGDLRTHSDVVGSVTRYDYNRSHGLIRITDPMNRVAARNDYDENGRLVKVTNADGRVITLAHDLNTRQETVTDAGGQTTVMEYDERGNVVRKTDARGGVTTSTYDPEGNQLTTTNPEGETITRTYDNRRNVLTEKNALGETSTLTYNERDQLTSRTDPLGHMTRVEYTASGKVRQVIDAMGVVSQRNEYDRKGNLTSRTDARGNVTQFEYDASGNITVEIDAKGSRTTRKYNASGDLTEETDRLGATVRVTLNARGSISEATNPLGGISKVEYDALGTLKAIKDPLGNRTALEIDAQGKPLVYDLGPGRQETRLYDIRGNLASVKDVSGRTTVHEYDELSRRITTTDPALGAVQMQYDKAERLTHTVDAAGSETVLEYDDAGRNIKRTDALGRETLYAYDAAGNLIRQTDAKGNVFRFDYDLLNRPVVTHFPDGTEAITGYDNAGNVTSRTDAAGHTTVYSYDSNNQLQQVIDPLGGITKFSYDAEGNLLSQTDAKGNITRFAYDASGQRVRKTYPDGTIERQTFNASGHIDTMTDAAGRVTQIESDFNGQPLRKVFADGTEETFTYTPSGKPATATNATGTVTYTYDAADRLMRVTNGDTSSITYGYDARGNRNSVTTKLPAGVNRVTAYAHDELNRIASVTDPEGAITRYEYDEIGNLSLVKYPNGVESSYEYDSLSRLKVLTHRKDATVLAAYTYELNATGDRTRVTSNDGTYVEFEYDALRRLTRESHFSAAAAKSAEWRYTYDAAGNRRTVRDLAGNETLYNYDPADKLLSAGSTAFSYDSMGNLASRKSPAGQAIYSFNAQNELTGVNTPGGNTGFQYDAAGERIRSDGPAGASRHLVDIGSETGVSQVLADYDFTGASIAEYTYGTELAGERRAGAAHYHHRDGSRNVRLISDSAGSVSDTYGYNAFGALLSRTGTTRTPYQFAGERSGESEGLVFLRARYYDPSTGRFISKDPFEGVLRGPVSLHRYLYANSNPVMFTDPTGQFTVTETMVYSAITGGLVSGVIGAISGKRGWALAADIVVGAVFGALGGPAGTAITKAMSSNKLLIGLLKSPAVGKWALRIVAAIPATLLDLTEDLTKANLDGDIVNAARNGTVGDFASGLAKSTFLNFIFNVLAGPFSVNSMAIKRHVRLTGRQLESGVYEIFKDPIFLQIPTGRYIREFAENSRSEELSLLIKFCWEWTKMMMVAVPEFIQRNRDSK